jgi:hypothetical protein
LVKLLVGIGLFGTLASQVSAQTIGAPVAEAETVEAKSSGLFVGVEGGISRLYDRGRENVDYSTKDYGVKLGYIFLPEVRVYATYTKNTGIEDEGYFYYGSARIHEKLEGDVSKFYIGIDRFAFITENLKLLAGLNLGYAKLNLEYTASYNGYSASASASDSGLTFGSKLGFNYNIGKHSEIEFGVNGAYMFFDETLYNLGLYAGYNYKF